MSSLTSAKNQAEGEKRDMSMMRREEGVGRGVERERGGRETHTERRRERGRETGALSLQALQRCIAAMSALLR